MSFSSILPIRRIFLTRPFVYLSRINNFLLVNHHDAPLETQFSSLSPTVNLLEGALDNFFLSLRIVSRRKEERRRMATTTTTTKKKDAKMRKREPATWLQPIRVDVKADRRSQRRIYNQHDCLTPHNQRPYPYHASSIVASPFVLPRPRLHLPPSSSSRCWQATLLSIPFTLIPSEICSSSLLSRLLFRFPLFASPLRVPTLGPLPLRAGPHYPDHDSK